MKRFFHCFIAVLFCHVITAAEPSWTVFHGTHRDNVSPETGLLKSWQEGGPPLLWKVNYIGNTEFPGYAGVTVAEGRVFTAGNVKTGDSDQNALSVVFALDEKTGNEIWRYRNGPAWVDKGRFPGERSTPTVDGNRVYAFSSFGFLACLEAATGKEIWAKNVRDEYEAKMPEWAYAESPIIDGSKVICWIGGEKAAVVAFDKMTGKVIWETPGTGVRGNYATMIAFDYADRRIYVNMNQTGVLAVDGNTGEKLFDMPHKTSYDVMATMPYFFDGKLLIISGYGTGSKLYKLDVNGKTITPVEVWAEPKLDNMHGGTVIKEGYVYTATHHYKQGRNWMCVKLEDGSIVWEQNIPDVGMGAITCADGMLYCVSEKDPTVALVKATPEKYEEAGRFTLPTDEEGGGTGMCWAHPVVCGKKLYLRHGKVLYCFDVAGK